ncbi:hypothetical protein GCM10010145_61490 [Streptomyces ruber]|uniref:Transposase n=2 Tax=Streptomyces TaxID=1883 RepID=A0A918EXU7_9ACTN|nr:hypothetical protein [Streptomyces ruber]GGQ83629.1 hypothetical protein GCM10010145_61490 [Streptomyces ruber]
MVATGQANKALHAIVMVRMKYDARTHDYVTRRTAQGWSKKDIIRCLKRFVAREVYHHLPQAARPPHHTRCPLHQPLASA